MSKRRDKKDRVLRTGESQRPDGRYVYVYTDYHGKQKFIYSWKLVPTDSLPPGRRKCLSLREKEEQLKLDMLVGIIPEGGGFTVLQLVKKYVSQKTAVKHSTKAGYKTVINYLETDEFGSRRIDTVKLSDAKTWLIMLQKGGKGYSTLHTIRGVLRPAFQMAVDDDLIRKNPFEFQLCTVVVNDSVTRDAITKKQERNLLKFIKYDEHFCKYYDGIYILFKTGLRISEFVGLTMKDIDFKSMTINVNHQLQRTSNMEYVIEDTKTTCGTRVLPMTEDVADCFRRIITNRKKLRKEPKIAGYSGFLFLDKNDMPMVALHWEKYFQHIIIKYNSIYKEELPKVTPHVCRHTYCSNMAKAGMNPKTLQYLMGHADISVTLNTYTHIKFDDAKAEIDRLAMSGNNQEDDDEVEQAVS